MNIAKNNLELFGSLSKENIDNIDLLKFMCTKNTDLKLTDHDGNTLLHLAAKYSNFILDLEKKNMHYIITIILINKNLNANKINHKGQLPLHLAVIASDQSLKEYLPYIESQNLKITQALINKTDNINLADNEGNTPLHLAIQTEKLKVIESLIRNKANINLPNKAGDTPLHLAIKLGNLEKFLILIRHNFDFKKNDLHNNTLLDLAYGLNKENNLGINDLNKKINLGIIGILMLNNRITHIDSHGVFISKENLFEEIIINLLPAMNNLENAFYIANLCINYMADLSTKEKFNKITTKNEELIKLKIEKLFFFLKEYILKKYISYDELKILIIPEPQYYLILKNFIANQLKELFKILMSNYPEKSDFLVENFKTMLQDNKLPLSIKFFDYYLNYHERIIDKLSKHVIFNNSKKPAAIINSFLDHKAKSKFQKALIIQNHINIGDLEDLEGLEDITVHEEPAEQAVSSNHYKYNC